MARGMLILNVVALLIAILMYLSIKQILTSPLVSLEILLGTITVIIFINVLSDWRASKATA